MKTFLMWVGTLALYALVINGLSLLPEPDED